MSRPIVLKTVSGAIVGVVTFTTMGHGFRPATDHRQLEAVLPSLPDEGPHRGADGTARILDLSAAAATGSSSFGAVRHSLRLGEGLTITDRDGVRLYFA